MIENNQKEKWLNANPEEDELKETNNGVYIIPYEFIEDKLDYLSNFQWGTSNFSHFFTMINNNEAISASISLIVYDSVHDCTRQLVGACTYSLDFIRNIDSVAASTGNFNEHYAATAKSLCIVNAAKHLGRTFGKYLNREN